METAIKKAVEGGYNMNRLQRIDTELYYIVNNDFDGKKWLDRQHDYINIGEIVSDPMFWQSLGRAMKWRDVMSHDYPAIMVMPGDSYENMPPIHVVSKETLVEGWKHHWHAFTEHLISDGTPDEFFTTLISKGKSKE